MTDPTGPIPAGTASAPGRHTDTGVVSRLDGVTVAELLEIADHLMAMQAASRCPRPLVVAVTGPHQAIAAARDRRRGRGQDPTLGGAR